MERVVNIQMIFYTSGGWELDGSGRVAGGDDLDSMLRFRLERKCDGIKHC
jgi:hypothetical protein